MNVRLNDHTVYYQILVFHVLKYDLTFFHFTSFKGLSTKSSFHKFCMKIGISPQIFFHYKKSKPQENLKMINMIIQESKNHNHKQTRTHPHICHINICYKLSFFAIMQKKRKKNKIHYVVAVIKKKIEY